MDQSRANAEPAPPAVKFCGLTRAEDAARGAELGARFLGVVFAGGPRLVSPRQARLLYDGAPGSYARVAVLGPCTPADVARLAGELPLDVVQLHGDPGPELVAAVRRAFAGEVWAVLRVAGADLPAEAAPLFERADAVVLDAKVPGELGGTGVALAWEALAVQVERARRGGRLVLAGGLTPENVRVAAAALAPDVVDVSSGVEQSPGIKSHARMAAFAAAVRGAGAAAPADAGSP